MVCVQIQQIGPKVHVEEQRTNNYQENFTGKKKWWSNSPVFEIKKKKSLWWSMWGCERARKCTQCSRGEWGVWNGLHICNREGKTVGKTLHPQPAVLPPCTRFKCAQGSHAVMRKENNQTADLFLCVSVYLCECICRCPKGWKSMLDQACIKTNEKTLYPRGFLKNPCDRSRIYIEVTYINAKGTNDPVENGPRIRIGIIG